METIPSNYVWTSECVEWLTEALLRLNWSYRDLDEALGYGLSRGSYTRQVCETGKVPSLEYKRRLVRWWNKQPQPKVPATLFQHIQLTVVPWLRAREGQLSNQTFSRRQAHMAAQRLTRR
jgi:hypothetical protein